LLFLIKSHAMAVRVVQHLVDGGGLLQVVRGGLGGKVGTTVQVLVCITFAKGGELL
jgi:hypothetical protein